MERISSILALVVLRLRKESKPRPAQVDAISKAQKLQKDFQVSIYSTRKSKNQKNGPTGALKGGTLLKLSTFLSQLKGGPLEKNFFENLTMPKN